MSRKRYSDDVEMPDTILPWGDECDDALHTLAIKLGEHGIAAFRCDYHNDDGPCLSDNDRPDTGATWRVWACVDSDTPDRVTLSAVAGDGQLDTTDIDAVVAFVQGALCAP